MICLMEEIIGVAILDPAVATRNIACPHLDSEVENVTISVLSEKSTYILSRV